MSWKLPLTDVKITEEDVSAVIECLEHGWLTMGPRTEALEAAIAEVYDVPHAVAVSSGTAALHLALLGAGIGPGDEVLVPAFTFVAGAAAVRYCGATPVFVEAVGLNDLNIDPKHAGELVSSKTRAVLATNLMGYACDLLELERLCAEHGLIMIEDCAQSFLAKAADGRFTGTVGTAGCLSFFSKKQLCVGEGGMVLTSDTALAEKARSLRSHAMTSVTWDRHRGHAESYDVVDIGFNFRLDEPRAALALSRLPRVDGDVEVRRTLVRRYRDRLRGLSAIAIPWDEDAVERSSHFAFPVVFETGTERDRVIEELDARGIQTTCYPALTTLTDYRRYGALPMAEAVAARHLCLPLSSIYSNEQIDVVIEALEGIVPVEAGPGS
jgi:dTDP-4-amino-4,6-dideoxygalactose transaminase